MIISIGYQMHAVDSAGKLDPLGLTFIQDMQCSRLPEINRGVYTYFFVIEILGQCPRTTWKEIWSQWLQKVSAAGTNFLRRMKDNFYPLGRNLMWLGMLSARSFSGRALLKFILDINLIIPKAFSVFGFKDFYIPVAVIGSGDVILSLVDGAA